MRWLPDRPSRRFRLAKDFSSIQHKITVPTAAVLPVDARVSEKVLPGGQMSEMSHWSYGFRAERREEVSGFVVCT